MLKRRTVLSSGLGLVIAAGAPSRARAAVSVRLVLDGTAGAAHGGFYQAQAMRLFAQRGLEVQIIQGGPDVNGPRLIAQGVADLCLTPNNFTMMELVRARLPVRAVMAIFQKDTRILMSHPRRDIASIADMKDMPLQFSTGSANSYWPWLKARFGFSDAQFHARPPDLVPFIAHPNAIREASLLEDPFMVERETGWRPKVFLLADGGFPGYAGMVLAPQARIDSDPGTIQDFVDIAREGWLHYLKDPAPANALIGRANPDMGVARLAQAVDGIKRHDMLLSRDGRVFGLGSMTDKRWKAFYDAMQAAHPYPREMDYRRAFDLRFIRSALQKFR